MGNYYGTIIPEKTKKEEAYQLADKILQHLIDKKIIQPNKSDCVLSENTGYPPAENFWQAVNDADQHLFDLKTNGLEVNIGRQVFHSGTADEIICPLCNTNIINSNWGHSITEWINQSGHDTIKCPECGTENSIANFIFNPTWAFGELGFTFWNWGTEFKNGFIKDIELLAQQELKIVYGKI